MDLSLLLSTAMKALSEADTVIAKQSDAILEYSMENRSYRHENRVSGSLSNVLPSSTPKDSTAKFLSLPKVDRPKVESRPTNATSYSLAVKSALPKDSEDGNLSSDEPTESLKDFCQVKKRPNRRRKRASQIATGCKPGIILGCCY